MILLLQNGFSLMYLPCYIPKGKKINQTIECYRRDPPRTEKGSCGYDKRQQDGLLGQSQFSPFPSFDNRCRLPSPSKLHEIGPHFFFAREDYE